MRGLLLRGESRMNGQSGPLIFHYLTWVCHVFCASVVAADALLVGCKVKEDLQSPAHPPAAETVSQKRSDHHSAQDQDLDVALHRHHS